jgi:Trk K+ transport system NAD-binding subunit
VSFFVQKERSLLLLKLDSMGYGFFIPFFFIMVGITFDVKALKEFDASLYPFLFSCLAIMTFSKLIPVLIWKPVVGLRKALGAGFLMVSQLSLIIAASSIALQLQLITPGMYACFVILAVVTSILAPIIYEYLVPLKSYSDMKVFIIGGSSTGVLLARRLKMHNKPFLIIEKNPDRFREIQNKGMNVVFGDGADPKFLSSLSLRLQDKVVVITGRDEENIRICQILREDIKAEKVVSVSGTSTITRQLKKFDIEVMDTRLVLASTLENLLIRPLTYRTFTESFENFNVEEIIVTNRSVLGKQVRDIPWHKDSMLMLARRGDEVYIPHGETYLKNGDILTILGSVTALDQAREIL